jgi:hypothetical protein
MSVTRRLLPTATLVVVVLISGLAHGIWSDRWALAESPQVAASRLPALPQIIGEWEGQDQPIDALELSVSEASGMLKRSYRNLRTDSTVSLLLVCGRPGPVSVHTPDACYRGAGYEQVGTFAKVALSTTPEAEFWVGRFQKNDVAAPTPLRILYAWTATGTWVAADKPRWTFARERVLYKLYVVRGLSTLDDPLDTDPALEFLRQVIPELNRCLFAAE